jgi:hypothetical protein
VSIIRHLSDSKEGTWGRFWAKSFRKDIGNKTHACPVLAGMRMKPDNIYNMLKPACMHTLPPGKAPLAIRGVETVIIDSRSRSRL